MSTEHLMWCNELDQNLGCYLSKFLRQLPKRQSTQKFNDRVQNHQLHILIDEDGEWEPVEQEDGDSDEGEDEDLNGCRLISYKQNKGIGDQDGFQECMTARDKVECITFVRDKH